MYSASTRGFYKDGVAHCPSDAVAINDAEYAALFEGQSAGLEIIPDESGKPILADTPELSLDNLKENLKREIDSGAEIEHLKYMTSGAGRAMIYQRKVEDAKRALAETNPKPTDYPLLAASIGIEGENIKEVANCIVATDIRCSKVGAQIERIRFIARKDIDDAVDKDAARTILATVKWPK